MLGDEEEGWGKLKNIPNYATAKFIFYVAIPSAYFLSKLCIGSAYSY